MTTPNKDDLIGLAERVESATGLDKVELAELERAIRKVCGAPTTPSDLPYVTSLDAAMTLVPEGISWSIVALVGVKPVAKASTEPCQAATPALALTAAALKAHASENSNG